MGRRRLRAWLWRWGIWGVFGLVRLVYFGGAVALIGLTAYFLGNGYLQALKGSDTFFHLTNILWFERFFPDLPYWYPFQNAGVVPVWGYPIFAYIGVILIERLSDLTLFGAFQVLGFLSVPLTALGLYLFSSLRLKNQTAGLIGAIFYVLAPISWVFLFDWGFYTESVSYMFIFPTLIFFDTFLVAFQRRRVGVGKRASLFGAVVFLGLTFLTHPSSFFTTLFAAGLLSLFRALDEWAQGWRRLLVNAVAPTLILMVLAGAFLGFILFDFFAYSTRGGGAGAAQVTEENRRVFTEGYATPLGSLLGLETIPPTEFKFGHRNIVVPPAVWVSAILGVVVAVIYSRAVLALAVAAAMPIVLFRWPDVAWWISIHIPYSGYIIHHRGALVFLRLFAPLVAGYGLWGVFRLVVDALTFWAKRGVWMLMKRGVRIVVAAVGGMVLAGFVIVYFANKPQSLWNETEVRYGPQVFDIRDPFFRTDRRDICALLIPTDPGRPAACNFDFVRRGLDIEAFLQACGERGGELALCGQVATAQVTEADIEAFRQECRAGGNTHYCEFLKEVVWDNVLAMLTDVASWPQPHLVGKLETPPTRFSSFIGAHKHEPFLRVDVSPYLGGVVQTLNLESDISQINLYAIQLSLLEPYWGYEQQVFFSESRGNTINVNNLARWFGIHYLFLDDHLDFTEKYAADRENWKRVDEAGVWQFLRPTKLYSWTVDKPTFLVVGSSEKAAFEPVFRTTVNGAYPYEDGWLVQGKPYVDDYSFEELKRFDGLILYGYGYHNRREAYELLDEYVKGGGQLLIMTGWQYVDADWELSRTPDFFPVEQLVWSTNHSAKSRLVIEDEKLGDGVVVDEFAPLLWNDQPWGLSVSAGGIRDWARTVLSVDGKPLAAVGNYGQGRVIWLGWNILGHINTYDYNEAEMVFFGNLLRLFGRGSLDEESLSQEVGVFRDHPDEVVFTFTQDQTQSSTLYWREAFYPRWRARLTHSGKTESVPIYKAGPSLMLMQLPPIADGDALVLTFTPGIRTVVGKLVSIITFVLLVGYVFFGARVRAPVLRLIRPLVGRIRGVLVSWQHSFQDEDS